MSKKSKIHYQVKIKTVQEYIIGKKRVCDICEEVNISKELFYRY